MSTKVTSKIGRLIWRLAVTAIFCGSAARPFTACASQSLVVPVIDHPPLLNGQATQMWRGAAVVPVMFDFYNRRQGEETNAYVTQDSAALFIAFVVAQREPLVMSGNTNGPAVLEDDSVTVDLWPDGAEGFSYAFSVNPRGAHYQ